MANQPEFNQAQIDTELQRVSFEVALRATDPRNLLSAPDFTRRAVASGYGGYINTNTESAFFGWMLAKAWSKA